MNILDNSKSLLLCFYHFGVRHFIDVLYSKNKPGSVNIQTKSRSGASGLTKDIWHPKHSNKKEGFKNYLEYSYRF